MRSVIEHPSRQTNLAPMLNRIQQPSISTTSVMVMPPRQSSLHRCTPQNRIPSLHHVTPIRRTRSPHDAPTFPPSSFVLPLLVTVSTISTTPINSTKHYTKTVMCQQLYFSKIK